MPSLVRISCAVMRTILPDCCTLPSSRCAASSARPISRTSLFLPLKANDEVRAMTFRSLILASMSSVVSARPSEKYSLAGSRLMLTKGSTAIERASRLASCFAATGGGRRGSRDRRRTRRIITERRLADEIPAQRQRAQADADGDHALPAHAAGRVARSVRRQVDGPGQDQRQRKSQRQEQDQVRAAPRSARRRPAGRWRRPARPARQPRGRPRRRGRPCAA